MLTSLVAVTSVAMPSLVDVHRAGGDEEFHQAGRV